MAEPRKPKPKRKPARRGRALTAAAVLAAAVFVGAVAYYAVHDAAPAPPEGAVPVSLYFVNSATKQWESEKRYVPDGAAKEVVQSALIEWFSGPKSPALSPAAPANMGAVHVKLLDDPANPGSVEVTFDSAYNELDAPAQAVCNTSLVYSLTSLDFVQSVNIYIQDMALLKGNGQPVGDLNRAAVMLTADDVAASDFETRELTLYFPDAEGMLLYPEAREIEVDPNQPIEKYIVEQIIKGPAESGLYPVIAPDVRLRSAKTEDGGKCYVDFTGDFIKRFDGGSTAESLMIYSMVTSLTELPNVKEVQLLSDGEIILDAKGFHMDLSKPFTRNDRLIAQ